VTDDGVVMLNAAAPVIGFSHLASGATSLAYAGSMGHETSVPDVASAVTTALAAIADSTLLTLAPNEALEVFGVQLLHQATMDDTGVKSHQIVSHMVTFGRTYRGTPIVGPVTSVVLDADGRMTHFDKGWRDIAGEAGTVALAAAPTLSARRDSLMVAYLTETAVSCGYAEDPLGNAVQEVAGVGCRYTYEDPLANDRMAKVREDWVNAAADPSLRLTGTVAAKR
jgi:hypothetical protein